MKQSRSPKAIPPPPDFFLRYPVIPLIAAIVLCAGGNFLIHAAVKGLDLPAALYAFRDGFLARKRDYGMDDGRFALYMAGLVQTSALAAALVAFLLSLAGRLSRASIPVALVTLVALPASILPNTGAAGRALFATLPFAGLYLAILVASAGLAFAIEKPFLARSLSRILGRIDSLDADTLTGYAFSRFGYDGLERLVKASRSEEFFAKLLACDDGRYSGLPAAVKARRLELKEAAKVKIRREAGTRGKCPAHAHDRAGDELGGQSGNSPRASRSDRAGKRDPKEIPVHDQTARMSRANRAAAVMGHRTGIDHGYRETIRRQSFAGYGGNKD